MAKAIMIQGTMSNAGKSLLAAGLCRIFRQDGYRTAPFKAQNMALNSFITKEGLEIGRAQAVQAAAAGIAPSSDMNPILLKPCSDTGSQVIVNGIPVGNMPAREYFAYKKQLIPIVRAAFESLAGQYDIIVIEGAGSPAEINLKQDDIVNMGMARMAGAPVLLAGDIDRGGVFAQLYGTVMLLEEDERAMIGGLLINKFRGDKSLLDPGVRMIEELCKIPVVGVVPYMKVDLEDEDSLSGRLLSSKPSGEIDAAPAADIAVIHFPRLSNFTDFQVLSCMENARVRYVESAKELGEPDLIILPGTKNTIEDLLWMRQNGLEALVIRLSLAGKPVFGICGGYQMMGERLIDEQGTESGRKNTAIPGMGFFARATEFGDVKTRTRVKGHFAQVEGIFSAFSGMEAEGYEIHMGHTYSLGRGGAESFSYPGGCFCSEGRPNPADAGVSPITAPLLTLQEYQARAEGGSKMDGACSGNLYGTYVHGIFDRPGIADALVNALLEKKGRFSGNERTRFDYAAYQEEQFDKLAKELRQSLDMKAIYEIMGMGTERA